MIGKIFKGILIAGFLCLIAYFGVCVYAAVKGPQIISGPQPPSVDKAPYSVTVESTGVTIYTEDISNAGSVYTLNGYWEMRGTQFIYRNVKLILDEDIFGTIKVRRRYFR